MEEILKDLSQNLVYSLVSSPGLLAGLGVVIIFGVMLVYVSLKQEWHQRIVILNFSFFFILSALALGILASINPTKRIEIIPYDHMKYADVFGGISNCVFYAYNPPWKVEESVDPFKLLGVHKKRYMSNVEAQYLFYNEDSFQRAKKFWNELNDYVGSDFDLPSKIKARKAKIKDVYRPTFFIGAKSGRTGILYPTPFMSNGKPEYILNIADQAVTGLLRNRFQEEWEEATPVQWLEKNTEVPLVLGNKAP